MVLLRVEDSDAETLPKALMSREADGGLLEVETSFDRWEGGINLQLGDLNASCSSRIERPPTNVINPTFSTPNQYPPSPQYEPNTPPTNIQNSPTFVLSPNSFHTRKARTSPNQQASPTQQLPASPSNPSAQPPPLTVQQSLLPIQQPSIPSSSQQTPTLTYQRKEQILPLAHLDYLQIVKREA